MKRARRRPVFRVAIGFGGRSVPREFLVEAPSAGHAMLLAARCARARGLARPYTVDAVVHVGDLDVPPPAKRRRTR